MADEHASTVRIGKPSCSMTETEMEGGDMRACVGQAVAPSLAPIEKSHDLDVGTLHDHGMYPSEWFGSDAYDGQVEHSHMPREETTGAAMDAELEQVVQSCDMPKGGSGVVDIDGSI